MNLRVSTSVVRASLARSMKVCRKLCRAFWGWAHTFLMYGISASEAAASDFPSLLMRWLNNLPTPKLPSKGLITSGTGMKRFEPVFLTSTCSWLSSLICSISAKHRVPSCLITRSHVIREASSKRIPVVTSIANNSLSKWGSSWLNIAWSSSPLNDM